MIHFHFFYHPMMFSQSLLYSWGFEKFEWKQTVASGFESTNEAKADTFRFIYQQF